MPRFQRRLKARRFAYRIQHFGASKTKAGRVKLIAQRKIVANGRMVTAGTSVSDGGKLTAAIAKPKVSQQGAKIRGGRLGASAHVKAPKRWGRFK